MKPETDVVERAMLIALKAHEGQTRKGTDIPYITHPLGVALILARAGADDEIIAAGILHDTVEDTDVTLDEIRMQFGERIANLVEGASEPDKSLSWRERKEHTLAYLREAPMDVRMVSCADKLHNVRSIKRDLAEQGDALWSRFNNGKDDQAWYYRGVVKSLGHGGSFRLLRELRGEVQSVFATTKSIIIPPSITPGRCFDVLFRHVYDLPDTETSGNDGGDEVSAILGAIHAEAWKIRGDGCDEILQMYDYLSERDVSFEINSEGTNIILAFCVALKRLFGLYNYELLPHIKRNLKYL